MKKPRVPRWPKRPPPGLRGESEARRELREVATRYALRALAMADGSCTPEVLDLLVNLAWVLGIGAEVSHHIAPGSAQARRLHGALRTVVDMARAGNRWRAEFGPALDAALREANALIDAHPAVWPRFNPGATWLAQEIREGRVPANAVAGAELYREALAAPMGRECSGVAV